MKNKIIVTLSVIIILVLLIAFIMFIRSRSIISNHADIEPVDISDIPIGVFNEDGTVTDGYGKIIEADKFDTDPINYKEGAQFKPVQNWYTETSYNPEIEQKYAEALTPFMEGNVTYSLEALDSYDYSDYAELADTIDSISADLLMDIYTDTDHYIATNDLYKIYWTRVGSGVINEVVYN